jgi:dTMP kinase
LRARFISLEGIDQSGKKTQTRLLVRKLRRTGRNVATMSFPVYGSPSGQQIRAFLEGTRNFSFQAVHMLYSLNRWENLGQITEKMERSDFLVADRYSASNLAYGLARGLSLDWLVGLDKGLPVPDTVIVLDVRVPVSFDRKALNRDLHEKNRRFLLGVRRAYLKLAKRFDWHLVDGTGPAEKVHQAVWEAVRA